MYVSISPPVCPAAAGGALRLSGTVGLWNVSFERNSATSEGPAISNIGDINNMSMVLFRDNYFSCNIGEFLEYLDVEVRIRMLLDVSRLVSRDYFFALPCFTEYCALSLPSQTLVFAG